MACNKPPTTYAEQLDILKARGLAVADESVALHRLAHHNYYRLSAYRLPLTVPGNPDQFLPDTSFDTVWGLYVFDRQLRQLVSEALQRMEISVRARWTYVRNLCAHHSRLWNRRFTVTLALPTAQPMGILSSLNPAEGRRIYNTLVLLGHLMNVIELGNTWTGRLHALLVEQSFPVAGHMGFPADWYDRPFWKVFSSSIQATANGSLKTAGPPAAENTAPGGSLSQGTSQPAVQSAELGQGGQP